ncbi:MAG: cold shock domain-containing protein [Chloroflexi bacterium]|nr:cold shock domain-containing protein [Chloroflexota bacterium]MCI0580880.1 cold shock domain-containing protein [Chloroflexota bacterium]MCI0649728.1 cold shock domain-containing protein [Chloroflexota bacterium]MCI0725467.1 cold shock domain-containing protein [Chloroflexota bacterium]
MSEAPEVGTGVIRWIDPDKQFGIIIQDNDGSELYFEFKDMEIGRPEEGLMVHFIRQSERYYGTVAKKIAVLSPPASQQKTKSSF